MSLQVRQQDYLPRGQASRNMSTIMKGLNGGTQHQLVSKASDCGKPSPVEWVATNPLWSEQSRLQQQLAENCTAAVLA